MRKLVSVQLVRDLSPIEGADRIEVATIQGWRVVVGKGEFTVGQKVAYFEIDSFLDGANPAFTSFLERGTKKFMVDGVERTGHVLRTAKLRGVISQGLALGLDKLGYTPGHIEALSVGDDITEAVGVVKWEPPLPMGTNIVGPFDSRFAPKTDAIRLQNLTDAWGLIKAVEWQPTLKVDGTSQTLVNDGGKLRIFGRNWELDTETAAGFKVAAAAGFMADLQPGMAVQFELVGPGVQGNRLKLSKAQAVVFAVWQNGVKVSRADWPESFQAHGAPLLGEDFAPQKFATTQELIDFVDGIRGNFTKDVLDEGVVWHPVDPSSVPTELATFLDSNFNFKVVSAKWLLKGGE